MLGLLALACVCCNVLVRTDAADAAVAARRLRLAAPGPYRDPKTAVAKVPPTPTTVVAEAGAGAGRVGDPATTPANVPSTASRAPGREGRAGLLRDPKSVAAKAPANAPAVIAGVPVANRNVPHRTTGSGNASKNAGATAVDRNVPHRANGSGNTSTTLPTILLAGVQKGGTTALAKWLSSPNSLNKGVCKPAVFDGEPRYYAKEVQFFNHKVRYERGVAFYERRFRHCLANPHATRSSNGTLLSMDATPNTLWYPRRVFDAYKRAGQLRTLKVVFSLREPISRELSW